MCTVIELEKFKIGVCQGVLGGSKTLFLPISVYFLDLLSFALVFDIGIMLYFKFQIFGPINFGHFIFGHKNFGRNFLKFRTISDKISDKFQNWEKISDVFGQTFLEINLALHQIMARE